MISEDPGYLPRQRSRWAPLATAAMIVGVLTWVAVPAALYVLLTTQQREVEMAASSPVWASVEANDTPTTRSVSVQIEWSAGQEVYAPRWTGLVEQVDISVGQRVASGQPVAVIGGVQRIALHTDRPFAKPLQQGDKGPDVIALNSLLGARDLAHGDADVYTRATHNGVVEFAKAIGVPDARNVPGFSPEWVLYLPADAVTVTETTLRVGAPAPAEGDAVIVGEEQIISARISDSAVTAQAAPGSEPDDSQPSGDLITLKTDETLLVAGQELAVNAQRNALDPAAFPVLSSLVQPSTDTVAAVVRQPPSDGQWTVPSAAILSGADGQTCVILRDSSSGTATPVSVSGQGNGLTVVDGPLAEGSSVLLAPPAREFSCN